MRRSLVWLSVSVLAATMLTGTAPGATSVTVADAGSGEPLVAGVLVDVNGSPLAGRNVKVYAWPGEQRLAKFSKGKSARLKVVGSGRTGDDGHFTVRRNSKGLPRNTRVFDATVVAAGPTGIVTAYDTSLEKTRRGQVRIVPALVDAPDDALMPARGALVSTAATATGVNGNLVATRSGVPALTLIANPGAPQATARRGDSKPCTDGASSKLIAKHEDRRTVVSSLHATTDGHESSFQLSSGSDASLGTATKMGKAWTVGGTATRALNSTTTWGTRKGPGHRELTTRYTMATWEYTLSEYGVCTRWRSLKPHVHEGGAMSRKGLQPIAGKCRPYEKGSSLDLKESRATRYEGGLAVAKIVGFDLNSTAGFSESERILVKITKKKRQICGTDKYPADQPKQVVVKKRGETPANPCVRRPCVRRAYVMQ